MKAKTSEPEHPLVLQVRGLARLQRENAGHAMLTEVIKCKEAREIASALCQAIQWPGSDNKTMLESPSALVYPGI